MIEMPYNPPPGDPVVLHQDDDLLVIDKASGLLSVPGKGEGKQDSLITRLQSVMPQVRLVHRLDCDTSGVIIFALTPQAQANLGQQFEHRKTQKRYVALIAGHPAEDKGRIDLPLCVDWPNRPKQHVDHQNGKPAQTDWKVLRHEGENTRVVLKPLTGRSHQLRVHMLEMGHPILGDPLYATGAALNHRRLMLHAEELRLRHPMTGAALTFRAPVPF
ncbi:MAG: RluA family pseudouridine synthase [Proteobacteria bacterium]|nr:RluA family pseudouridine synthase [Pseudomonadota bacterium]